MSSPMTCNQEWRDRQRAVMPWGTSTCSKAARYMPEEPAALVRGKGCRVWDVDGREFIDFRNGLGPVTLGYAFPEVNEAITAQLADGIVYGHPHCLECEVAELLVEVIPCAEQVRFLKTGGEALAACIRMARAYTGREHIVQIGYNGWLNALGAGGLALPSLAASPTPPRGVPGELSRLHHTVGWGKLDEAERVFAQMPGEIAAVVVAAGYRDMDLGETFLPGLRNLTEEHGALLIHDEIVTGFRIALAGAQEYFGVRPDLAVFAKGVANGMPLSVYGGRAEIMNVLNEVIISSTYGGEALSLAAAQATIAVYRRENVVAHLWHMGEQMWGGLNRLFERHGLPIRMKGFWPCAQLCPPEGAPPDIMERFFRAAYRNGVSLYGVNYMNFSHREADVAEALQRLDQACESLIAE